MSDLIRREDALDIAYRRSASNNYFVSAAGADIAHAIQALPTVTVQAQIDAAVAAERAAASEYCWQRYQNRKPMNLTSPAVFTSHSHQDIVEHMERAAAIRKGEKP
jgi:hypothetical protein